MPTATNMAQLKKMLLDEAKKAMQETHSKVKVDMDNELESFYSQGNPLLYERTGRLLDSARQTVVVAAGSEVSFNAYLEPPTPDPYNRAKFLSRGYASYFTGEEILSASQTNAAGILGKGGYWERILKDIKTDLSDSMKSHFG